MEKPVTMGILSDASPLGLGAVLVSVDQPGRAIYMVEAVEAKFTRRKQSCWASNMANHPVKVSWRPWQSSGQSSCGARDFRAEPFSCAATVWWPWR